MLSAELSTAFVNGFSGHCFKFATSLEVLMEFWFRNLLSNTRCRRKDLISSVAIMLRRVVLCESMVW
jgi:hypothetical protein